MGKPIIIHYYAPLNEKNPTEILTYEISNHSKKDVIPKDKKEYVHWNI